MVKIGFFKKHYSMYEDMSKPEKEVSEFLKSKDIFWHYGHGVFVIDPEHHRPRVWTPDFYLPDLGLYIEVIGAPRKQTYEFRKMVYDHRDNRIPIIFVKTFDRTWKRKLIEEIKIKHQKRWDIIKEL